MTESANQSTDIWRDDLLGRAGDARLIIDFTTRRIEERLAAKQCGSYVLNIDAAWGQGKTFFLSRLKKQLDSEDFLSVYINAWEDDHADDPLVAVIAAVDKLFAAKYRRKEKAKKLWEETKSSGLKIAASLTKGIAKTASKRVIGEEAVEELKTIFSSESAAELAAVVDNAITEYIDKQTEEMLQRFEASKSSIENFRKGISSILAQHSDKKPLFVLVDELDRCRPTYAIELLERVKHLFSVDRVIFIVATDGSQLQHAISAVYGEKFDGNKYLLRFFDRTYFLPDPSLEIFVQKLFSEFPIAHDRLSSPRDMSHAKYFAKYVKSFTINGTQLTLRDAEQSYDILRSVVTLWDRKAKIELTVMLPLIFCYQQRNMEIFNAIGDGDWNSAKSCFAKSSVAYIEFSNRASDYDHKRKEKIAIGEILHGFMEKFDTPLYKILINRSTNIDGYREWIWNRFQEEHVVVHRGQTNNSLTLLRSYPAIVQGAGRFTDRTG